MVTVDWGCSSADMIRFYVEDLDDRRKRPRRQEFVVPEKPVRRRVDPRPPGEHLMYDALGISVKGFISRGKYFSAASCVLEQAAWDIAYGLNNGARVEGERVIPSEEACNGLGSKVIDRAYPISRRLHGREFFPVEVLLTTKRGIRVNSDVMLEERDRNRLASILEAAVEIHEHKEVYRSGDCKAMEAAKLNIEHRLEFLDKPPEAFRPVYRALSIALGERINTLKEKSSRSEIYAK